MSEFSGIASRSRLTPHSASATYHIHVGMVVPPGVVLLQRWLYLIDIPKRLRKYFQDLHRRFPHSARKVVVSCGRLRPGSILLHPAVHLRLVMFVVGPRPPLLNKHRCGMVSLHSWPLAAASQFHQIVDCCQPIPSAVGCLIVHRRLASATCAVATG